MFDSLGPKLDDPDEFFDWIYGSMFSIAALTALVGSGVVDRLDQGPATIEELSDLSGIPASNLARLVDFLLAHQVVTTDGEGQVHGGPRLENLQQVACYIEACRLGNLPGAAVFADALRIGKSAFEQHKGKPVFEYYPDHPEEAANFAELMTFQRRRYDAFIFAHHRFEPFRLAVDVGGSEGGTLFGALEQHPGARGILFDLPNVVAQASERVAAHPLGARVELAGGSFFESVPAADLYLLRSVLHDWSDAECVAILKTIRAAIELGGRLAVIEHVLPDTPAPCEALYTDIAMMIWTTGRERKLSDFKALFEEAGFAFDRITENRSGQSVMEAVRA